MPWIGRVRLLIAWCDLPPFDARHFDFDFDLRHFDLRTQFSRIFQWARYDRGCPSGHPIESTVGSVSPT